MSDGLTRQERGTIYEWLRHRRRLRRSNLVLLRDAGGRADRYYSQGEGVVGVEVTQVLVPEKQRMESDARLFLTRDVARLVAGRLPRRFFGFIHLPWKVPPKGTTERRALAEAVAEVVSIRAVDAQPGKLTDASLYPWVKLHIHPTQGNAHVSELVWGGMNSLYGGFEGSVSIEQRDALCGAIVEKAARGQLSQGVDHRVLLLQDKMLGIAPTVLDEAIDAVPTQARAAFDEIALVSTYNDGHCHCLSVRPD